MSMWSPRRLALIGHNLSVILCLSDAAVILKTDAVDDGDGRLGPPADVGGPGPDPTPHPKQVRSQLSPEERVDNVDGGSVLREYLDLLLQEEKKSDEATTVNAGGGDALAVEDEDENLHANDTEDDPVIYDDRLIFNRSDVLREWGKWINGTTLDAIQWLSETGETVILHLNADDFVATCSFEQAQTRAFNLTGHIIQEKPNVEFHIMCPDPTQALCPVQEKVNNKALTVAGVDEDEDAAEKMDEDGVLLPVRELRQKAVGGALSGEQPLENNGGRSSHLRGGHEVMAEPQIEKQKNN